METDQSGQLLTVIQDIVLKLMNEEDTGEIHEGLKLIESICRHRVDVRSTQELAKYAIK
jgi:hypothetical protein